MHDTVLLPDNPDRMCVTRRPEGGVSFGNLGRIRVVGVRPRAPGGAGRPAIRVLRLDRRDRKRNQCERHRRHDGQSATIDRTHVQLHFPSPGVNLIDCHCGPRHAFTLLAAALLTGPFTNVTLRQEDSPGIGTNGRIGCDIILPPGRKPRQWTGRRYHEKPPPVIHHIPPPGTDQPHNLVRLSFGPVALPVVLICSHKRRSAG